MALKLLIFLNFLFFSLIHFYLSVATLLSRRIGRLYSSTQTVASLVFSKVSRLKFLVIHGLIELQVTIQPQTASLHSRFTKVSVGFWCHVSCAFELASDYIRSKCLGRLELKFFICS